MVCMDALGVLLTVNHLCVNHRVDLWRAVSFGRLLAIRLLVDIVLVGYMTRTVANR